jgi:PKD repeat protein
MLVKNTIMKKLHTYLIVLLLIFVAINSFAQGWMEKIPPNKQANPNFYDIQTAFYKYNSETNGKDVKAFKKFKRWEWFMQSHIDQNGFFPSKLWWNESQHFLAEKKELKGTTANWTAMGPFSTPLWITQGQQNGMRSGAGRIECIEFHPTNDQIIWIGAHSGGFWKTTNGGANWSTTTDQLPSIGISDIVVHPSDPNTLYISTGDRDGTNTFSIGVLKSTNAGETWSQTGLIHQIQQNVVINELLINPVNPNILFVASTMGIFKTTDGGDNWNIVANGNFKDITYKAGDPDVIYTSTFNLIGGARLYKSEDAGNTFTEITNTGLTPSQTVRISIAVSPADPNVVFIIACGRFPDTKFIGLYKSTNNGDNWVRTISGNTLNILGRSPYGNDDYSQGWYNLSIAVSRTNINEIYTGGINMWKSMDGGYNWQILTHETPNILPGVQYMWVDHHELKINPLNDSVYDANDGGLYKSTDNGDNWADLSDGLEVLQIYRIGTSASDTNVAVVGCQDQFAMYKTSEGWGALFTGEAGEHFIDYNNPAIVYSSGYGGGLLRSEDGGVSFATITPQGIGSDIWLQPFIMHPSNSNTLYFAHNDVYKSINKGDNWVKISNNLTGGALLTSLEVSASNDNYIYTSTQNDIWCSHNGGISWNTIRTGLPNGIITDISISNNAPEKVWVTFGGFIEGQKIYYSDDAGSTWTNITLNLPNLPVNCATTQVGSLNAIYIGTDVGIYYKDDNHPNWMNYSTGLPNVIVNEMEINYASGKLRAGTYGRGLWESDIFDDGTNAAYAQFMVNSQIACGDDTIHFTDASIFLPTSWEWTFTPNTVTFVDGTNANSQNPSIQFNAAGEYTVALTATNANGSTTITKENMIKQADIIVDFISNRTRTFQGGIVSFYDITQCDPTSWSWEFQPSTISYFAGTTASSQNPMVKFNEMGNYTVNLTASNANGTSSISKTDYITVSTDYYMNNDVITVCSGNFYDSQGPDHNYKDGENYSITFIPATPGKVLKFNFTTFDIEYEATCSYDYLEIYDGNNMSADLVSKYCGTNSPGVVTATNETGALTFTFHSDMGVNGLGWAASIECVDPSFDISKIVKNKDVSIYPNPSNGNFNIDLKDLHSKTLYINIYNMQGKLLFSQKADNVNGNYSQEVALDKYAKGIFNIEIITDEKIIHKKIVLK